MKRSASYLIALVCWALIVGSQAVLGAEQISKSGRTGIWTLRDTDASPATVCHYDAPVPGNVGIDLDVMDARTPRIRARDRSPRRDAQWVGVRIVFQRSVMVGGGGGWQTVKTTSLVKELAYDDTPATFGRRTYVVDVDDDYRFRVLARMTWYTPGSKTSVQGRATALYERYLKVLAPSEGPADDCPTIY